MNHLHALKPTEYPVLTLVAGHEYLESRRRSWVPGSDLTASAGRDESYVQVRDAGGPFEPARVASLTSRMQALALEFPADVSAVKESRNAFDLDAAEITYECLQDVPMVALLDKDFWRYVVVHELFQVVIWRIPDSGKPGWLNNFALGTNWPRCYPYKAYLRGRLIAEIETLHYPWTDTQDVDFYDSHLFSSRNGLIPSVASALNTVRQTKTSSQAMRPFATTAVRYRGTHATELLTPEEVLEVLRRYSEPTS